MGVKGEFPLSRGLLRRRQRVTKELAMHVVMLRGPVKKRSQKREQTVESTKRSSFI